MKTITILGATGSVGRQTLEILRNHKQAFTVQTMTAYDDVNSLAQLALEFQPKLAVIGNPLKHNELKSALGSSGIQVASGEEGLLLAASESDIVVSAIVGIAGLKPTFEAIKRGACIAIANKETIVAGGFFIMRAAKQYGARLIPVDSEASAIFQIENSERERLSSIAKIIITASGGPFWKKEKHELTHVTPQEARRHPTWDMGLKISIDSATLVNKGLELLETHYLFDVEEKQLDVLIHPESTVHGLVQYVDGSILAQLAIPDMRIPIQYALFYPNRKPINLEPLDLSALSKLTFFKPDEERFEALKLARRALQNNQALVYNAANEAAVDLFIKGKIGFLDITTHIQKCLDRFHFKEASSIEEIVSTHNEVCSASSALIEGVDRKSS